VGKSLHYYLHYLEVHFVFWPPGGLFLQESGCWKRDRLLFPVARSSSLAEGELFAAGSRGFSVREDLCVAGVCACLRVCVSVCVVWVGS